MNQQSTKGPRTALSRSQQAALVKLLGDDDESVVQSIRDTIFSYGAGAQSWLEPYLLDNDPRVRSRVRQVVHELGRKAADTEFLSFCIGSGEDLDIEQGEWLLARTRHPEINTAGYQAVIDSFAADLQREIDPASGAEGILATINNYLFERQGFFGNEEEYYDPENSYLNSVMDRRTGNPVSLCLIYLFVARRLKLPAVGIGMPGHFLLRFQFSTGAVFVDAFNGGRILSKADCVKHLTSSNHGFLEAYLAPISPRRTLLRVCSNLHHIYKELDADQEAIRLQGYLIALAK
ncbi:MAG: transglutaminase-like domain-containing protein [Verrucomicrobia bacterium]|jgi:regulator of sirC expression with transglutaminase-like and TPR domain|nr:transglutaminase-like domain-containing protein [Verrucomicrobiota bacterium]